MFHETVAALLPEGIAFTPVGATGAPTLTSGDSSDGSPGPTEFHDTTLNVYTQVLDGSVREAVQNVGDQMFTIVHRSAAIDAGGTLIS